MSGLDVESFNLFGKKPNKVAPRPVAVPVTSPTIVEEEIKKFDAEIETRVEMKNDMPQMPTEMNTNFSAEIERFEVESIPKAPVMNNIPMERRAYTPAKSIEVTLKAVEKNNGDAVLRKFETFVAPTFRIPESHDLELKKIEHFIMRNRKKGANIDSRERITTNTVVRAMIANFLERAGDMDLSNIDNEEMLKERMEKIFKSKYTKRA
jgi:hypothetical protein